MFKFLMVAACSAVLSLNCFAQSDTMHEKKFNHYVGFQANLLLKQLFNFSNTNTVINNPYLLVYSIAFADCGWGAHAGIGYTYKKTLDKGAPVGRESKTNDFFYRIGAEKRFSIGKRFSGTASLDFTASNQLDKTLSKSVTSTGSVIDSSTTTVTGRTSSIGGGPRVFLGYQITERLILATEATMYYSAQKQKQNILVIDIQTDLFNNIDPVTTASNLNTETDVYGFSFTVPVSLFLIVKF